MYGSENIINKIRNYKYVSFDIFDTLILRNVLNPSDIFKIIQNKIGRSDFYIKRINAEKEAVRKSLKEEITLEEIYSNITELKSDNEKEYVMNLEKETEIKYSLLNPIFREIIDYCRKNNMKIIIASDMYLDESTIKSILEKNKVEYDYLYLSSKINLRKSRGKMYTYILKDLGISKNELVHIGDNKLSDYIVPKIMGIKSILYTKSKDNLYTKSKDKLSCVNNIADNICFSFIRNNIMPENNKYYNFGFKYLGMLIYGMCQWIHEEAQLRNINSIYFIARDGFILKKAYDLIYKNEQTKYLYLSRRSLTVPMLRDVQSMKDILDRITYIKRKETMDTFMHKLGIDDESFISELKNKYGNEIKRNELLTEKYTELFDDIKEKIKSNAQNEFDNCVGYLQNNIEDEKIIIVDLGWYGTIQKCLEKILEKTNKRYDITGCYLGVIPKKDSGYELRSAKGYIYDYKNIDVYNQKLIFGFNGLIESIFTADHGSVKKYKEMNENYEPVLEEWENVNWSIISRIHEGALNFVQAIKNYLDDNITSISNEAAFAGLNNLLTKPSLKDVQSFQDIIFYDSYYKKLVNFRGRLFYMKNFKTMLDDFGVSNWKIGFLKKLITIDIPIDKVYLFLMKLKESH